MARQQGPSYDYVMLAEATERQRWANVYAVVVECSVPRPTKGTGGSLQYCIPFSEPAVQGRIDSLNDLADMVTQYNGKPQLVAKIHKAKECSFCLFDGRAEGSNTPYQVSSESYTYEGRDASVITALRSFGQLLNSMTVGSTAYMKRIKDIRAGTFFDVICQVLAVNNSSDEPVMYVWDGTDALPLPFTVNQSEIESQESLPEAAQPDPAFLAAHRRAMHVHGNGVLSDLPTLGTALPIVVTKPESAQGPPKGSLVLPSVGSWIKLRNVKAWVVAGQLQGRYLPNSKWAPCSPDDQALAEDEQRLQVNNVAGWAPSDPQHWLARTHHSQPFTSVRELQLHAGQGIPRKDRCLVNVLRYMPAEVADFCHPRAQLGLPCTEANQDDYTYLIKLHLQDATGELDAALFDKDADEFFQGFPAQDYSATDGSQHSALQQKMDALLGLHNPHDSGAWLECCIKTYFTDRKRPLETCQFRIFDTRLQ